MQVNLKATTRELSLFIVLLSSALFLLSACKSISKPNTPLLFNQVSDTLKHIIHPSFYSRRSILEYHGDKYNFFICQLSQDSIARIEQKVYQSLINNSRLVKNVHPRENFTKYHRSYLQTTRAKKKYLIIYYHYIFKYKSIFNQNSWLWDAPHLRLSTGGEQHHLEFVAYCPLETNEAIEFLSINF